jgi:hypothetical protein
MKKVLVLGLLAIMLVFGFTGCEEDPVEYYDYGIFWIDNNALDKLSVYQPYKIYTGSTAKQVLGIVVRDSAGSYFNEYHEKKSYDDCVKWLKKLNLPTEIASKAEGSITAHIHKGSSETYWLVCVEDVSSKYNSVLSNSVIKNNAVTNDINTQDMYIQKEAKLE